jgi:hypothetical protein
MPKSRKSSRKSNRNTSRKSRGFKAERWSTPRKRRTYRSASRSTNEINKEIETRTNELDYYLEKMDGYIQPRRRHGAINAIQIRSAEGEWLQNDGLIASMEIKAAHETLFRVFPEDERRYDTLIRRYANLTPTGPSPWKQKMASLGFGSNEHYNMTKALDGIPIGRHRPFFAKLVKLGLIEQTTGLPSSEVQMSLTQPD